MPLTDAQFAAHTAVWCALSDLFLDTEPDDNTYNFIARECANSPFSCSEIKEILVDEVSPVCRINLLSVAGVWDGFDQQWLIEKVEQQRKKNCHRIIAWPPWLKNIGFQGFLAQQWQIIEHKIQQLRHQE